MLTKQVACRDHGRVHVYLPQLEVWTKVTHHFMGILYYTGYKIVL